LFDYSLAESEKLKNCIKEIGKQLLEAGYSFVPILPGEKRPGAYIQGKWVGLENWQQYAERFPTRQEIEQWATWPGAGLGLLTGHLSGVVGLDFDHREDLREEIEKIIPLSPVRKIGARGYTGFYRFDSEDNKKYSVEGETVIEILSDGRQTLLPPTLHPQGHEYKWMNGETLLSIDKNNLPYLDRTALSEIEQLFTKFNNKQSVSVSSGTDIKEIQRALAFLDADDYELWVKIGMALQLEPGGFDLWDTWSKKSEKYKPGETDKKWQSFRARKAIGIGTLFYEAQKYGYKKEFEDIKTVEICLEQQVNKKVGLLALPEELLTRCPGLPGKIAEWVCSTMKYPHPALALGVALTAVGALKGHRLRTENNARTNLYIVGLAPSGSGKNDAMDKVMNLLDAAGCGHLFGGEPASDSAVLKCLQNNRGRRLLQWDEIGIALAEMTSQRAAPHKAAILKVMMKLFSGAGGTYYGKEYADLENKMRRQDIQQPHLCVFGASTPARFYESLNSGYALDGFLARWLILETSDHFPKRRKTGIVTVPANLISAVQELERLSTNAEPSGNLDAHERIVPKIVKFGQGAEILLEEIQDYLDEAKRKAAQADERIEGVYARAGEHILKIALTVEESTDEISKTSIEYARDLVMGCCAALKTVVDTRVGDSEYHRNLNRVLRIIQRGGIVGVTASALTRAVQGIRRKEREEIINQLCESERIEIVKLPAKTKQSLIYRAKTC
jgi:hypothetical protein